MKKEFIVYMVPDVELEVVKADDEKTHEKLMQVFELRGKLKEPLRSQFETANAKRLHTWDELHDRVSAAARRQES